MTFKGSQGGFIHVIFVYNSAGMFTVSIALWTLFKDITDTLENTCVRSYRNNIHLNHGLIVLY